MANPVTQAELRDGIRQITDTVTDRHKSDTWLNSLINRARPEVFEILRRADPDFYEASQTITTTGVASYNLSADYHETKGVEWLAGTNDRRRLDRVSYRNRLKYQGAGSQNACAFRIVQSQVELYPTPPAGQTYFHVYVPAPVPLAVDADTVDGREAQFIILRAAIPVVQRDGGDPGQFEADFERELQRMTAQTDDRNHEPRIVECVETFDDPSYCRRRRWWR